MSRCGFARARNAHGSLMATAAGPMICASRNVATHVSGMTVMPLFFRTVVAHCIVLGGLLASTTAWAYDESLSFRRSASGSIEAVVSGLDLGCAVVFAPPNQVTLQGSVYTVSAPEITVSDCFLPNGPGPYSVTADLGLPHGQRYDVVWNQPTDSGSLQLTAVLVPANVVGAAPVSLPTLSLWALSALAFLLATFAVLQRRFTRSRM